MFSSFLLAVTIVAHDPGYYTSLANHISRWLKGQDVASEVVTPKTMATSLANEKIAFLVGFESPSDAEMKTLRAYSARGGKLVVFHSASPKLGELMGVKPVGYKAAFSVILRPTRKYKPFWSSFSKNIFVPIISRAR